jgi:methionine-rich copper-binding protein CopC
MQLNKLMLGVLLASVTAGQAFAHAHLVTAVPQPQGTVQAAPAEVSIDFTEGLVTKASSIRVEDAKGMEVDTGDVHADLANKKRLIVGLKPLSPGTYKVIWKATATDTHKTDGTYTFTVMG